jgi:hypothetical protein
MAEVVSGADVMIHLVLYYAETVRDEQRTMSSADRTQAGAIAQSGSLQTDQHAAITARD